MSRKDGETMLTIKIAPQVHITKTLYEWKKFKHSLDNKLDDAFKQEFKDINGWNAKFTPSDICDLAKDHKKWVHCIEESGGYYNCCNNDFYQCIANDAGQIDTKRARDVYYLLGTNYYVCGICWDDAQCWLKELADTIEKDYDIFNKQYME